MPLGCPGDYEDFRAQVNDAIRVQIISAKVGTTSGSALCPRTGDYDVALRGYITIWFRFHNMLDPDVRYRILHLLDKTGAYDTADNAPCNFTGETENHLLQIESSRYLTNQILDNAFRSEGDIYVDFHNGQDDNVANGMTAYILTMLQGFLQNDFKEYNSTPYQTYSIASVLNLADDAGDVNVATGARAVLDYLSAKFAVSDNLLRRSVPYRRRPSDYSTDLVSRSSDPLKNDFMVLTGMTQILANAKLPFHARVGTETDMQIMAVSSYEPPSLIMDLIMNPAHRHFFERFKHDGVEIYSSEPEFLISSGGIWTGGYLTVLGGDQADDQGIAVPTVLIPTQMPAAASSPPNANTNVTNFIRIDGVGSDPCLPGPCNIKDGPYPNRDRVMTCVTQDFACGINPVIPEFYLTNPACVHTDQQVVNGQAIGQWTFLDRQSSSCVGNEPLGFDVAVYSASMDPGLTCLLFPSPCPGTYDGTHLTYGFFEAQGGGVNTRGQPASFQSFWQTVLANNQGRSFGPTGENVYKALDGREIHFLMNPPADNKWSWPILADPAVGVTPNQQDISAWPLVQGDVLDGDGHSGMVTVTNDGTKQKLVINFVDSARPMITNG